MTRSDPSVSKGPDFYDDPEVFNTYMRGRMRPNSPNATIEKPIFHELLGDVVGARILDLGCGDGAFGQELLRAGCESYTGIEASQRMVAQAQIELTHPAGEVVLSSMENWEYPAAHFDLVLSRLALHYIDDVASVLRHVHQTLTPSGRFIFSVEHPVLTSCNRSRGENGDGVRQDWIVDDYFVMGKREVMWMGQRVIKVHRTIEEYFTALQEAGFIVTHLRESRPMPQYFTDDALFRRRSRIPLFLFLAAQRSIG
jgi:SAM-dependent methyltransferase